MNHFLERITHMLKKLFPKIFGVPTGELSAAASTRQQAPETYLPEHKLTSVEIAGGVNDADGSCWTYWRTETNSGLRWFRRISAADVPAAIPERIFGIDAGTHEDYDAATNYEQPHAWLMDDDVDGLPEETDELR
jgi:hypothetical protein